MTMSTTSYTPRHSQTVSPPLSVATPSTVGPHTQRLNIVTRLAIEGNAKRTDSVPIKVYMKVCCLFQRRACASDALLFFFIKLALPIDNIVPGSAIPLFKGWYHHRLP
jgi:hypothetical protein